MGEALVSPNLVCTVANQLAIRHCAPFARADEKHLLRHESSQPSIQQSRKWTGALFFSYFPNLALCAFVAKRGLLCLLGRSIFLAFSTRYLTGRARPPERAGGAVHSRLGLHGHGLPGGGAGAVGGPARKGGVAVSFFSATPSRVFGPQFVATGFYGHKQAEKVKKHGSNGFPSIMVCWCGGDKKAGGHPQKFRTCHFSHLGFSSKGKQTSESGNRRFL